jgi:hypothetical protein
MSSWQLEFGYREHKTHTEFFGDVGMTPLVFEPAAFAVVQWCEQHLAQKEWRYHVQWSQKGTFGRRGKLQMNLGASKVLYVFVDSDVDAMLFHMHWVTHVNPYA